MNKLTKSRLVLIGLILIFFLPIALSWYLVFFSDYKNKMTSIENGILVEPVIPVGEIESAKLEDNSEIETISGRWTLVFFVDKKCDDKCNKKLYQVRQIRLALGKNVDKVDRLLISNNVLDWSSLSQDYLGQKVLDNSMKDFARVKKSFNSIAQFNDTSFYLIDPYGFIMMQYKDDIEPKGIIRDIERLIRNAG